LVRDGILTSAAGKVTLAFAERDAGGIRRHLRRSRRHLGGAAPSHRDSGARRPASRWCVPGERAGAPDGAIDFELVKELAFLLFSIAEKNGWTQDALAFNTVATAWPDDRPSGALAAGGTGEQAAFAFEED
jgi:putative DNA methylase